MYVHVITMAKEITDFLNVPTYTRHGIYVGEVRNVALNTDEDIRLRRCDLPDFAAQHDATRHLDGNAGQAGCLHVLFAQGQIDLDVLPGAALQGKRLLRGRYRQPAGTLRHFNLSPDRKVLEKEWLVGDRKRERVTAIAVHVKGRYIGRCRHRAPFDCLSGRGEQRG